MTSLLRRALLLAVFVGAFVCPGVALAQNITLTMTGGGVTRSVAHHSPSSYQYYISQSDCLSSDAFDFPYSAMSFQGLNIEVWLDETGNLTCNLGTTRNPASTGSHCTMLTSVPATKGGDIIILYALRALRDADAFPAADVGLLRAMTTNGIRPSPEALAKRAEAWRPWRAYAAQHLWTAGSQTGSEASNGSSRSVAHG